MRKSFDALSGIVTEKMGRDPLSGDVFIFMNRRRNKVKLLHWEPGGFVLYYKRLESGTLEPLSKEAGTVSFSVSFADLVMLIEGIEMEHIRYRKRYKKR